MNPYANPYRSKAPSAISHSNFPSLKGDSGPAPLSLSDDHELARLLEQLTISWSDALVQSLQKIIATLRSPSLWNWSTMTLFIEWVFSTRHDEHQRNAATVLLASVVDAFTEEQVYAAALFRPENVLNQKSAEINDQSVPRSTNPTVLEILASRLSSFSAIPGPPTSESKESSNTTARRCHFTISFVSTLIALSSFFRALERLDMLLSFTNRTAPFGGDITWWTTMVMDSAWFAETRSPEKQMMQLFLAVESLDGNVSSSTSLIHALHRQNVSISARDNAASIPSASDLHAVGLRPEQVQIASLTVIYHVRKYRGESDRTSDGIGIVLDSEGVKEWEQKLWVLAARLSDQDMPRSSYTFLSLTCLRLLVTFQVSPAVDRSALQSVVAIVVRSLLMEPISARQHQRHDMPRWTHVVSSAEPSSAIYGDDLYKWTLGTVLEWTRTQQHPLFNDSQSSSTVARFLWTALLQASSAISQDQGSMVSACVLRGSRALHSALLVFLSQSRWEALDGLDLALKEFHDRRSSETSKLPRCQTRGGDGDTRTDAIRDPREYQCAGLEVILSGLIVDKTMGSALVLSVLLQSGQSIMTHDSWSQSFWKALTGPQSSKKLTRTSSIDDLVLSTVQTASTASSVEERGVDLQVQTAMLHPKLHCLLDLLHCIFTHVESGSIAASVVCSLSAQSVEVLVHVMASKRTKVHYSKQDDPESETREELEESKSFSIEMDDSITPTASNLSRVVDTMQACLPEDKRAPVGIEPSIRLAAATLLATMAQILPSEVEGRGNLAGGTRRSLLQARMMEVVNSFVDNLRLTFVMPGLSSPMAESNVISTGASQTQYNGSFALTQRRLRLLTTLASSVENQEYLAQLLHRVEASHRRDVQNLERSVFQQQQRVQELLERQNDLEAEKSELYRQRVAQVDELQQQMARFQRNCSQKAKQLVNIHQLESSRAERQAEEILSRMKGLQDKLASCEQQLEACMRCEVEARTALDHAEREMTQIRQDYEAELQQSDSRAKELDRVAQELQSTKPKLQCMIRNEKKMLAHIELQDASIQTLDEAHASMKDSLETLFADMVSLAKLYESKEKEEHKSREQEESTIEDLTRQLRAERARYAQLEETYRQTEVNNNMLSSKYEKVRKLLEQEREERNNESARFAAEQRKRFAPASYMSHLHTSSANMRSDRLNRDRMRLVLSNEGKENDISISTSSRVSHKSSSR